MKYEYLSKWAINSWEIFHKQRVTYLGLALPDLIQATNRLKSDPILAVLRERQINSIDREIFPLLEGDIKYGRHAMHA